MARKRGIKTVAWQAPESLRGQPDALIGIIVQQAALIEEQRAEHDPKKAVAIFSESPQ
jgi:hypothetical protein